MTMGRLAKDLAKRTWYRVFRILQRVGINLLPQHFYSGVPDVDDLARRGDWRKPRSMFGIAHGSIDDQLALLGGWLSPHRDVLQGQSIYAQALPGGGSDGGYGEIEAEVLFGFVARGRPARVIQIGCGVSTAVILMASEKMGYRPAITCVEPYPSAYLKECASKGLIRLIERPAQLVAAEELSDLGPGDLLFIDSTHAVKPGSEVNYLIHEVLPRLQPGVWVHFHDIYFPYDYTRDVLSGDLLFPQESTLLYAFLTQNNRVRLAASLSMIHYANPDGLRALIPKYAPRRQIDGLATTEVGHFPSSAWLQTVGAP
jgi:hypothetical protein